ncbi:hypothetical protein DFA_08623 [Cavenderia fasciculata]|uniref:Uncharacterized protein n=1 Tax=Cavenderia fasciculata TaxID=261658 RepID=F4Q3B7_CACFS|nr:uncharacterized protein DFA_08623 [Cavenderia fasciculata]EGG17627.1 hypothetical protein DFA_08623 [Cavenderia fasciculata]|eukprot:XP_004356111.1 hypothetical protein DFA_08623 [Cavenderia fasciculata]
MEKKRKQIISYLDVETSSTSTSSSSDNDVDINDENQNIQQSIQDRIERIKRLKNEIQEFESRDKLYYQDQQQQKKQDDNDQLSLIIINDDDDDDNIGILNQVINDINKTITKINGWIEKAYDLINYNNTKYLQSLGNHGLPQTTKSLEMYQMDWQLYPSKYKYQVDRERELSMSSQRTDPIIVKSKVVPTKKYIEKHGLPPPPPPLILTSKTTTNSNAEREKELKELLKKTTTNSNTERERELKELLKKRNNK